MAIDSSIPLQVRLPEIQNPLAMYLQAMQLEGAQSRNALSRYQLSKAEREDGAANALAAAYRNPDSLNPDGSVNRNALAKYISQGPAAGQLPAVLKSLTEVDKGEADLDKTRAETSLKHLQAIGGALVAVMQDPSDANLMQQFAQLKAAKLPVDASASKLMSIPDIEQRRQAIKGMAFGTPEGRAALQAIQPKAEWRNNGQFDIPVQSNSLAPGYGGVAPGMAPIQQMMTPDARDASARGWAGLNQPIWDGERGAFITRPPAAGGNGSANIPSPIGPGRESTPAAPRAIAALDASGQPLGPKPTTMSASLAEKLAQNNVTLRNIDLALDEVERNPGAFGLKNYAPDAAMQRLDPSGVDARALVANIAGQKIHDRSGAAVTVSEAARLRPYVPNTTDTPGAIKSKLQNFRREYEQMQQELMTGRGIADVSRATKGNEARGAIGQSAPVKPKLGERRGGYLFKGGDPASQSSWEKVDR